MEIKILHDNDGIIGIAIPPYLASHMEEVGDDSCDMTARLPRGPKPRVKFDGVKEKITVFLLSGAFTKLPGFCPKEMRAACKTISNHADKMYQILADSCADFYHGEDLRCRLRMVNCHFEFF